MASTDWLSQGTLVLASNNKGKIVEFEKLFAELNLPVEVIAQGKLNIEDAIEDGLSFVENAIIKARHASKISGKPAIADDSGICVPVLDGAPGIYSARYAGEHGDDAANNQKLLAELKPLRKDAQAIEGMFVCVLVLVQHADDPLPQIFQGMWRGAVWAELSLSRYS
jgi:XTP/dITP diphosphohydrolase